MAFISHCLAWQSHVITKCTCVGNIYGIRSFHSYKLVRHLSSLLSVAMLMRGLRGEIDYALMIPGLGTEAMILAYGLLALNADGLITKVS